jgi:hypothetical protein
MHDLHLEVYHIATTQPVMKFNGPSRVHFTQVLCKKPIRKQVIGLLWPSRWRTVYSSRMLVDSQQTTLCYVPEDYFEGRQFKLINTVVRLHVGHPQNQCSTLARARDSPFLQSIKTASGCHLPCYTLDTGASFHGGKADHWPPSSTKIKNCMNLCYLQGMVFNYHIFSNLVCT